MKKKPKYLYRACLLCLSMFLALVLTDNVKAENTASIALFQDSTNEKDMLVVTVYIQDNPGIAGLGFKLRYDDASLTLNSVEISKEVFPTEAVINQTGMDSKGKYIGYFMAEVQDQYGTGKILTAKFKVNDMTKAEMQNLSLDGFDVCDANLDTVIVNTANKTIFAEKDNPSAEAGTINTNTDTGAITNGAGNNSIHQDLGQSNTAGSNNTTANAGGTTVSENNMADKENAANISLWVPSTVGGIRLSIVIGAGYIVGFAAVKIFCVIKNR